MIIIPVSANCDSVWWFYGLMSVNVTLWLLFIALHKAQRKEKHSKVSNETENRLRSPSPHENDYVWPSPPPHSVSARNAWENDLHICDDHLYQSLKQLAHSTEGPWKWAIQAESPTVQAHTQTWPVLVVVCIVEHMQWKFRRGAIAKIRKRDFQWFECMNTRCWDDEWTGVLARGAQRWKGQGGPSASEVFWLLNFFSEKE